MDSMAMSISDFFIVICSLNSVTTFLALILKLNLIQNGLPIKSEKINNLMK